jgi:hypothetical protein
MKNLLKSMLALALLTCNLLWAQAEDTEGSDPSAPPPIPPIPPKVPGEELEPSVVITEREGERIEEYIQNGRVYMVKITPIKGPAYYYLDENGDGQLELSESERAKNGPVRPVFWKVKEW